MADNVPFSFHRRFCPETCSRTMEIPISYMNSVRREYQQKTLPKVVLLRDSDMNIWSVEITQTEVGVYFKKGWEKLVADYGLKSGHHLIFEYDGKGLFEFLLFDEESNVKIAVAKRAGKNKSGKAPETLPVDSGNNDNTSIIQTIKKETDTEVGGNDGGKGKDEENETVSSDMAKVPHSKRRRQRRDGCAGKKKSKVEIKDVPDHYGLDIFKYGHYTQPTNPYFVTRIHQGKRNNLYIPMDVLQDITLPPSILLRDPRGKEWKTKTKVWSDGRTWLTGGWMHLCRRNLVEINDRLVCEFLPQEEGADVAVLHVTAIIRESA
ncbi:unnamed protein product [Cuscuta epithymum]|uniref:TF-B3 domain-containing protein n=1 Tax=Cuscuta epithymum TaxID=186058 RepID=A0AAV0GGV9_9ASTE|nr:unnamed protein product [Cuscuta epithymum]